MLLFPLGCLPGHYDYITELFHETACNVISCNLLDEISLVGVWNTCLIIDAIYSWSLARPHHDEHMP